MNTYAAASATNAGDVVVTVMFIVSAFVIYWVPTIVAVARRVPNRGSVAVINLFGFVLLVPWIVAMAMAVRTVPPQPPAWQPPPGSGPAWFTQPPRS